MATLDEVVSNDATLLFGIQRDREFKTAPGSLGWQSLSLGLLECPVKCCSPRLKIRTVSPGVSRLVSFRKASASCLWMMA